MTSVDKEAQLKQKQERAKAFRESLAATGLSIGDFAKAAGFTRNVIYNLSIGQAPSNDENARRLSEAFARLRRKVE